MMGVSVFLKRMFTVFLAWPKPASTPAKPRCMMKTSPMQTIIHTLLAVLSASNAGSAAATAGALSNNVWLKSELRLIKFCMLRLLKRFYCCSSNSQNEICFPYKATRIAELYKKDNTAYLILVHFQQLITLDADFLKTLFVWVDLLSHWQKP